MAVAQGLTALHVGVTKCADNISGQSSERSQRRRKGSTQGETQEVEERSRWRWSPRRFGVHRNQDRFIPLGARPFGRAPFLYTYRRRLSRRRRSPLTAACVTVDCTALAGSSSAIWALSRDPLRRKTPTTACRRRRDVVRCDPAGSG